MCPASLVFNSSKQLGVLVYYYRDFSVQSSCMLAGVACNDTHWSVSAALEASKDRVGTKIIVLGPEVSRHDY